jgi:hypothetical protein
MALPPPPTNVDDGDDYDDDANTDSVTDAKSNPRDTGPLVAGHQKKIQS